MHHLYSDIHTINSSCGMLLHFIAIIFRFILKPIFHCDEKTIGFGSWRLPEPQRHNFALGIPTCWCLKTRKFALPPTQKLKLALGAQRKVLALAM